VSVTVRRHATSGNYRIPSPGQEFTCRDIYVVTWAGDPASAPSDGTIITDAIAAGLPAIQSRHPSCDANLNLLVCQSHDWQKNPACSTSWNVTVTWGTYANFLNGTEGEGADTEPFTRVTRVGSMRIASIFRTGITPPVPASYVWPPTSAGSDIGGTKVDINGVPSPLAIPQMQITVEWLYDRTNTDSNDGAEPDNSLFAWLGVRNDADFLGFSPGYVLCTGANASPVNDQWYMMQFTYVVDYWAHYEQKSAPNVGGLNFLAAAGNFLGVPFKQSTKVAWWQPYTDLADLNDMFPADVLAAITTANPTSEPFTGCLSAGRDFTGMQFDFTGFP